MGTFGNTFSNMDTGKAALTTIPGATDAMVWLDGTILNSSGTYYFVDKSGNGRNFLITSYDFPGSWTGGFPYKSLATISAPAGDTALIAADVNSFLYTSGTPNQIPVTALFQDIDYEHKIFTRHVAQQLDGTNKETLQPHVKDFVVYNTVKSSTLLTACQSYYGVPTENTSTCVWLAPTGNDTTGAGTKVSPYRSLDKIKATTATTVYMRTGSYDCGSTLSTFTGSTILLQGTGNTTFNTSSTSNGMVFQRNATISNCHITCNATSTGISSNQNIELNRCKFSTIQGSYFVASNGAGKSITIQSCIIPTTFNLTSLFRQSSGTQNVYIHGCYGKIVNSLASSPSISLISLKYNRGLSTSSGTYYTLGAVWKDNLNIGTFTAGSMTTATVFSNEIINSALNLGGNQNTSIDSCTITGNITGALTSLTNSTITGTVTLTGINNLLIQNNTITAATTNANGLVINGTNGSNITGVVVDRNTITINGTSGDLLFVGGEGQSGYSAMVAPVITRNKLVNLSTVGSGNVHHCYIGGGINAKFWYNDVTVNNGSALLFKNTGAPGGSETFTSTSPSAAYNVFRFTGTPSYGSFGIATFGLIFANNTYLNVKVGQVLFESDDLAGSNGSLLLINNVISLAANIPNMIAGPGMTSRNNLIKTNGFTYGTKGAGDAETTVTISSNAIPASRLDNGETTELADGLDVAYAIPTNVVYKTQDATWQKGAVVL